MNDLFKKYGLSDIDDSKPLNRTIDDESKFDTEIYNKLCKQQDEEMHKLQKRYLEANPEDSLDSIIRELGYEIGISDELTYFKWCGDYTCVVDFEYYELGFGYFMYYVLDPDNNIPEGYCATKYKLEEPTLEEDTCDTAIGCRSDVRPDFMNNALEALYNIEE